jgi:hypothetical protein
VYNLFSELTETHIRALVILKNFPGLSPDPPKRGGERIKGRHGKVRGRGPGSIYRKISYRIADIDISVSYRQFGYRYFSIYRIVSAVISDIGIKRYFFKVNNSFGYGNVKCSLTVLTFTNFLDN